MQKRFQGNSVQKSNGVVQNVVQYFCIPEQKLGAGRVKRYYCISSSSPDISEADLKKVGERNARRRDGYQRRFEAH